MSSDELHAAALALPTSERARLAHDLLASLDEQPFEDVEAAWAQEISRRAQELDDGVVEPVDAEAALDRVQQRLQERRARAATTPQR
jgi:putative addiction module component (TIGR02574 family)